MEGREIVILGTKQMRGMVLLFTLQSCFESELWHPTVALGHTLEGLF